MQASHTRRIISLILGCFLLAQSLPLLAASQTEKAPAEKADAVSTEKKEIVYATLNGEGKPDQLIVINHFNLSEAGTIVDYGQYDSVERLTGDAVIQFENNTVTASLPEGEWYYQGVLKDAELPWLFTFHYFLDGKELQIEELSGASGLFEMKISIRKNEKAAEGFYDDFLLQLSLSLLNSQCRKVRAPGATQASAGKSTLYNYVILPGSDADIQIKAEVENFSMPAPQFAALPMNFDLKNMNLKDVNLQGLKDSDGLKALTDAVSKLDDGAAELAEASGKIRDGLGELNEGAGKLGQEQGKLRDGISDWADGMSQYRDGLRAYLKAVGELAPALNALSGGGDQLLAGLLELSGKGGDLRTGYGQIQTGIGQLSQGLLASLGAANGGDNGATGAGFKPADLQNGKAKLDALIMQMDQLAPFMAIDLQTMIDAMGTLAALPLPTQEEMAALAQFSSHVGEAQSAQTVLNHQFSLLASYAASLPSTERNNYLMTLQSIQAALKMQTEGSMQALGQLAQVVAVLGKLQGGKAQMTAAIQALTTMRQTQSELASEFAGLRGGLAQMRAQLAAFESGAAAVPQMGQQLAELSSALASIDAAGGQFGTGLGQYLDAVALAAASLTTAGKDEEGSETPSFIDGLHALSAGAATLAKSGGELSSAVIGLDKGARKVKKGSNAYLDGVTEILSAVGTLDEKYGEFNDGMTELAKGTKEFRDKSGVIGDGLHLEIEKIAEELMPDYKPRSFVSSENKNISSLQFVILGKAVVEAAKEENSEEAEEEEPSFLDKLRKLF